MKRININTGTHEIAFTEQDNTGFVLATEAEFFTKLAENEPIQFVVNTAIQTIEEERDFRNSKHVIQTGKFQGETILLSQGQQERMISLIALNLSPDYWITTNGKIQKINPTKDEFEAIASEIATKIKIINEIAYDAIITVENMGLVSTPDRQSIRNFPSTIVWP